MTLDNAGYNAVDQSYGQDDNVNLIMDGARQGSVRPSGCRIDRYEGVVARVYCCDDSSDCESAVDGGGERAGSVAGSASQAMRCLYPSPPARSAWPCLPSGSKKRPLRTPCDWRYLRTR